MPSLTFANEVSRKKWHWLLGVSTIPVLDPGKFGPLGRRGLNFGT